MNDPIEQLENEVGQLDEKISELEERLSIMRQMVTARDEQLLRMALVVQAKLTRRQQKIWPKWIAEVDLGKVLKLKETFAFPKIGLQAMDRGKWVRLTGTEQPEGLTPDEGRDICEYLNSFPENQVHLKNMDSEFRTDEQEKALRKELEEKL